ncbi:MAG: sulfatase-like hydrolase/transferase [Halanaerobiaceae bacterium]
MQINNDLEEFKENIDFNNLDKKPNVVWLDAEDMCPDLGCYGLDNIHTPNLDKLAGEGIRYNNAFTTAPVCSASRSAVITGSYQTGNGTHHHRSHRDISLVKEAKVFTDYFKEAGYFICNGQNLSDNRGKMDYNFAESFEDIFDGTHRQQRKEGQPFFAEIHFSEAHRKFVNDPDNPVDPESIELPPYLPDNSVTRAKWIKYLETIQVLDKKVGKVLESLENEGFRDNTIIIFTGDHGMPHIRGKQWLYDAGIHIPLIVSWPETIKPGQVCNKMVSMMDIGPTLLHLAGINYDDEKFDGQPFLGPEAVSREYIFAARDRCDETIEFIRCVRNKRYKLILNFMADRSFMKPNRYKDNSYPAREILRNYHNQHLLTPFQKDFSKDRKPPVELYDIQNDPYELNNLARSQEHGQILAKLKKELKNWMLETGDLGFIPEPELYKLLKKYGSVKQIKEEKNYEQLLPQLIEILEIANQYSPALQKLLQGLKSEDSCIRYWSIRGIITGGFVNEKVKKGLESALNDKKDYIKEAAAGALSQLGCIDKGLPVLIEMLNHENKIIRHFALLDLEELGEIAASKLDVIEKSKEEDYEYARRVADRLTSKLSEKE